LGPTAANSIVLLYHAVVVYIRPPVISEVCSRNLAGEKVIHIQSQVAGVEAVAHIQVPLGKIVMEVRIGFPGAAVCADAVVYIRGVHPELEAGVVHIRLAVYKGACILFLYVELLIAMVDYMLIVCVERQVGVAHIHLSACEEVHIAFPHIVVLVAVAVYIPIVYVERQKVVVRIHPLACQGARMHFLDE
jgi:hypothetical protein